MVTGCWDCDAGSQPELSGAYAASGATDCDACEQGKYRGADMLDEACGDCAAGSETVDSDGAV